jgi:hypothetical protein
LIFDANAQLVVGNMGWIDRGALWTFDVRSQQEARIPVEGSTFLSLRAGANGFLRLIHHQSPDQAVSIRHTREPHIELASVRLRQGRATFFGDAALWRHVEPAAIIATDFGQKAILIDAGRLRVTDLDLTWFTSENYDLGYQGLVDSITLRSTGNIIISVQRSSTLVIIDQSLNERVGSIALASRGGNPRLQLRNDTDLFACDYDTLCRIDTQSLVVLSSARLQDAAGNTQQFIGDYEVTPGKLVVARPFSGDVLLLDPDDFRAVGQTQVGGQPLAVCKLSGQRVITRDWKTGRVAISQF